MRFPYLATVALATLTFAVPLPQDDVRAKLDGIIAARKMEHTFLGDVVDIYFRPASKKVPLTTEERARQESRIHEVRNGMWERMKVPDFTTSPAYRIPRDAAVALYLATFHSDPQTPLAFWKTKADMKQLIGEAQDAMTNAEEMRQVWDASDGQTRDAVLLASKELGETVPRHDGDFKTAHDILRDAFNVEYHPLIPAAGIGMSGGESDGATGGREATSAHSAPEGSPSTLKRPRPMDEPTEISGQERRFGGNAATAETIKRVPLDLSHGGVIGRR